MSVLVFFVLMLLEVPLNWCTGWFLTVTRKKACDVYLKNVKLGQAKHNCLLLVI